MSIQYKKNNFSTEKFLTSDNKVKNSANETARPNIDDLIKKILVQRRRERKNVIALGLVVLSILSIFIYF
jgi:hypothetical protein|tara:strand:- start:836 stop:1045 length:210 start_codon:yes stop_codon:yes gene_type:complete